MSRAGGRDVAVAMRDCGISTTSQTRPVCKHCFSALPIDKTVSVEAQIGLLWCSFAHLATGCGIKAKDPSELDSDRWIPHSRCCENPARAKALAGFSRHLSAGFTDLNPAPRGLSLWNYIDGDQIIFRDLFVCILRKLFYAAGQMDEVTSITDARTKVGWYTLP